jgi:hypothetical protein
MTVALFKRLETCYEVQKVMELHVLHAIFQQKLKIKYQTNRHSPVVEECL